MLIVEAVRPRKRERRAGKKGKKYGGVVERWDRI